MTQGDFFAFVVAAFMMYGPIKKLSRVNTNLQQAIAASERIFELLDTHSEVARAAGRRGARAAARTASSSATSASRTRTARASTCCATSRSRSRAGQVIAIVGLSGAGKTTLVNLIPRFYDVDGGAILIDGVDIRDVTLKSLRAQIGIVTQETVLFDETIASNIAYGSPGASRAEIEAAARAAHAHEFIVDAARAGTTRGSASAASGCRAGSGSGWRSRGRC